MKYLSSQCCCRFLFDDAHASHAQTAGSEPLRVGIAGLAHGHVDGFFQHSLHRPEIQLVGIAEPDQQLASRYARNSTSTEA